MGKHDLKIWPEFFTAIVEGKKTFEIRVNDRDFKVGDILILREWHNLLEKYTGRIVSRKVTYITQGAFGLPDDICVMSLKFMDSNV